MARDWGLRGEGGCSGKGNLSFAAVEREPCGGRGCESSELAAEASVIPTHHKSRSDRGGRSRRSALEGFRVDGQPTVASLAGRLKSYSSASCSEAHKVAVHIITLNAAAKATG